MTGSEYQHSHNLLGVVYLCGTGLEWRPKHAQQHKRTQTERLGPQLGARFNNLRGQERTPAEEEEYRLLYLQSELADPTGVETAWRLLEAEQRLPANQAVNTAINTELKRLDLSLQQSGVLRSPPLYWSYPETPTPGRPKQSPL